MSSPIPGMAVVNILTMDGKLIQRIELRDSDNIDIGHLANGIYFMEMVSNDKRLIRKVIKQ